MDRLWTPWRYSYISKAGPSPPCIFCAKHSAGDDAANYIVHRAAQNFVILNLYPYTNGHLMIAPYQHVDSLCGVSEETLAEMMTLTRDAERLLRELYRPDGVDLGMNLGESAGAGVAGHIHMHVLPRWTGDANFMSVVGETRVLPEMLDRTYSRLLEAFSSLRG